MKSERKVILSNIDEESMKFQNSDKYEKPRDHIWDDSI